MAERSSDPDGEAPAAAEADLGTRTIEDTGNEALRRTASERGRQAAEALEALAREGLQDRDTA